MLILGSYGFSYTQMRLKIGELIPDQSGRMLIVPLACMFEQETGQKEKNGAAMLHFKRENIDVFDRKDPELYLGRKYDYIAVPGGNTFQLLYYVKQYRLDSFIRQQAAEGAVYLGFSAGAYLACRDIAYVRCFDDNNHITDGDFTALGLTDKYVLCHFDDRGVQEIKMCRSFIGDAPELITIRNDQIVVVGCEGDGAVLRL